jgi:hypothetical protein
MREKAYRPERFNNNTASGAAIAKLRMPLRLAEVDISSVGKGVCQGRGVRAMIRFVLA